MMYALLIVVVVMVIWGVSIGVAFSLESMLEKDHKIKIDDENGMATLLALIFAPVSAVAAVDVSRLAGCDAGDYLHDLSTRDYFEEV